MTVPIYETSSAEQVQFVLDDSGAVAAFAETDAHVEPDRATAGQSAGRCARSTASTASGTPALDELAEAGKAVDAATVDERLAGIRSADPATLIYTSGTTGRPKGCQLTHSNLLYEIRGAKACFPDHLAKGEKLLVFLPLAHVLARALTIGAFANGVTLGFTSDIKNLVPMFAVFKPTLVVSVPRVFEKVYNTAEQNAESGGKGKIFAAAADAAIEWSEAQDTGGAGLRAQAQARAVRQARLRQAAGRARRPLPRRYLRRRAAGRAARPLLPRRRAVDLRGLRAHRDQRGDHREPGGRAEVGSVGKLLPGNSMKLGEDGELLVKGGVVFSGYWGNETETNAVFSDGWFHTGDLGAIDDNGFLSIVGRKKEIIVTAGGKNVAPALLEDRLRAHSLISQAMAVGDAQPFIAALITIDPEAFPGWKERNGKAAGASVADLADRPRPARRDRAGGQGRQPGGVEGRADPQVPDPAGRFHRGHRRADPDAEGQAQGRGREVRGRHRRAVHQSSD